MSRKIILLILLVLIISMNIINTSFASGDDYTNIPLDTCYTEQGFIWYKQSSYIKSGELGYWDGNNSYYHGKVTDMPNPTNSACGAISFAIIATNVRQELITPRETIQYFCDTGLYTGNGSSHSCGVKASQHWELSYDTPNNIINVDRSLDKDIELQWMVNHLRKGHWIQILVKGMPNIRNSIWSYNGGHYVAIHGYNNGNTFVYDSCYQKESIEKEYSLEEVWENIRSPHADNCKYKYHMTAIW